MLRCRKGGDLELDSRQNHPTQTSDYFSGDAGAEIEIDCCSTMGDGKMVFLVCDRNNEGDLTIGRCIKDFEEIEFMVMDGVLSGDEGVSDLNKSCKFLGGRSRPGR